MAVTQEQYVINNDNQEKKDNHIQGREVVNKYNLGYEMLAKAVFDKKIKCYNSIFEEIVDASQLKSNTEKSNDLNIISFPEPENTLFIIPDNIDVFDIKISPLNKNSYFIAPTSSSPLLKHKPTSCTTRYPVFIKNYFNFYLNVIENNSRKNYVIFQNKNSKIKNQSITFKFLIFSLNNESTINKLEELWLSFQHTVSSILYQSSYKTLNKAFQDNFNFLKSALDDILIELENIKESVIYIKLKDIIITIKENIEKNNYISDKLFYNINEFNIKEYILSQLNKLDNFSSNSMDNDDFKNSIKKLKKTLSSEYFLKKETYSVLLRIINNNGKIKFFIENNNEVISHNQSLYEKDSFRKEYKKIEEEILQNEYSKYSILTHQEGFKIKEEIKNKFRESLNYQAIYRNLCLNREYKIDYYYFNLEELYKYFPNCYSEKIKKIVKNDIFSFYFKEDEIQKLIKSVNSTKDLNYNFYYNATNLKEDYEKFLDHCYEIFKIKDHEVMDQGKITDATLKKDLANFDDFFKQIEQKNKTRSYFLKCFIVYYYEYKNCFNEEITPINIYEKLKPYIIKRNKNRQNSDNISKTLCDYRIIHKNSNVEENSTANKENHPKKKENPPVKKYFENIFPFLDYNKLISDNGKVNHELIAEQIRDCSESLKKLGISIKNKDE